MAGADPGDGGRSDGPSLDDAGVAQLPDPSTALDAAEASRATAQEIPGGQGMATVPCGATRRSREPKIRGLRAKSANPRLVPQESPRNRANLGQDYLDVGVARMSQGEDA